MKHDKTDGVAWLEREKEGIFELLAAKKHDLAEILLYDAISTMDINDYEKLENVMHQKFSHHGVISRKNQTIITKH